MCDTALANCNNANGAYSFWSQDFMYTGGIAMSPDDTKVFYTTATQIFYISAVGATAGSPVAVGAPLSGTSQYRGISWAPVTPSCGAGVGGDCCTPGMPALPSTATQQRARPWRPKARSRSRIWPGWSPPWPRRGRSG